MYVDHLVARISGQSRTLLWLVTLACAVWFGYAADDFFRTERANTTIQLLLARNDAPINVRTATPQEILARVNESLRRDQIDNTQAALSLSAERLPPAIHAAALYNIANFRTLLAAEAVRKGDLDGAAALINLAKSEYRLALKLDPANWDARYNIDVAMRIVRDLPQADNPDKESPDAPKKLWTDLPGIPKGLP